MPTLVSQRLLGGTRVGRWHGLAEELALAFAMGTHDRLGAGAGGRWRSRWMQFKAPAGGEDDRGCHMPVLYDAGGSGEACGGGVRVGGRGGGGGLRRGSAAADGSGAYETLDVRLVSWCGRHAAQVRSS
jgi:hypothetical protein